MRVLDNFIISVDFCSDPVTLIMAVDRNQVWEHTEIKELN